MHLYSLKNAMRSAICCGVMAASKPSGMRDMPVDLRDFTSLRATFCSMPSAPFNAMLVGVSLVMMPAAMRPSFSSTA